MGGIAGSERYTKNIRDLRLAENCYEVLACADVRYANIKRLLFKRKSAARVLMAILNKQTGTVEFVLLKRPRESESESSSCDHRRKERIIPATEDDPLRNCALETTFDRGWRRTAG